MTKSTRSVRSPIIIALLPPRSERLPIIITLAKACWTGSEIAEGLGCSRGTVQTDLRAAGTTMTYLGGFSLDPDARFNRSLELYIECHKEESLLSEILRSFLSRTHPRLLLDELVITKRAETVLLKAKDILREELKTREEELKAAQEEVTRLQEKLRETELIVKDLYRGNVLSPEVQDVLVEAVDALPPGFDDSVLDKPLYDFELSVRAANCLEYAHIRLVGDLVHRTEVEMLSIKNLGHKTLGEIRDLLAGFGLHLGMKLPRHIAARFPIQMADKPY